MSQQCSRAPTYPNICSFRKARSRVPANPLLEPKSGPGHHRVLSGARCRKHPGRLVFRLVALAHSGRFGPHLIRRPAAIQIQTEIQGAVAQRLLDEPDVMAAPLHQVGSRVAQAMEGPLQSDLRVNLRDASRVSRLLELPL